MPGTTSPRRFRDWKPPTFDSRGMTKWGWMCQHPENLKVGKYVDIGAFTYINALHGVVLEDLVQVGSHSSIYSVSTIDDKKGKVVVERDARIGSHSLVMPGVTIGEGAVIGAYSFVTGDVPPETVGWGIPYRPRRPRNPH